MEVFDEISAVLGQAVRAGRRLRVLTRAKARRWALLGPLGQRRSEHFSLISAKATKMVVSANNALESRATSSKD